MTKVSTGPYMLEVLGEGYFLVTRCPKAITDILISSQLLQTVLSNQPPQTARFLV